MRGRTFGSLALVALWLTACGDPETTDTRGYTKAPLEEPEILIGGEEATAMAELGRPDRPRPVFQLAEESEQEEVEGAQEQQVSLAEGVTQAQFDQGQEVFTGAGGCTACHGASGGGSPLGPDLTDAQWLHISGPDVGELTEVVRTGVPQPVEHPSPMPPMGGASLSEEQVQAVAAYVASIAQGG